MIKTESIDIREDEPQKDILQIRQSVRDFELKLRGYIWSSKADKMIYPKYPRPLAKTKTINALILLLQPFSNSSNLITGKEKITFIEQRWETYITANRFLRKNIKDNSENYELIMKSFKNVFQNILDVTQESKNTASGVLGIQEEIKQAENF